MEKENSIFLQNVYKTFVQNKRTVDVLLGITTMLHASNSYAITGASGSGKSTLLHVVAGLDKPTSGLVMYGQDHKPAGTFGIVFQSSYLIQELNIAENVMLKALIAGYGFAQAKQEADFFLNYVGLFDKALEMPAMLSGGQQQRVAVARALMAKPSFLLADEPTGNLDEKNGRSIIELLLMCQQEWGMGLIVSSHDRHLIDAMNTVLHLEHGKLV